MAERLNGGGLVLDRRNRRRWTPVRSVTRGALTPVAQAFADEPILLTGALFVEHRTRDAWRRPQLGAVGTFLAGWTPDVP